MLLIILLVVLGIGLVAVYMNREKDEEKARLAISGLTIAILVVAVLSVLGIGGGTDRVDTSTDESISVVAADRIAQAATGTRVVLIADSNPNNPFALARIKTFRERFQNHNKEVVGVQPPWPTDFTEHLVPEEGLSTWGIEEALRNFGDVDVVVSLAGFPIHGLEDMARQLQSVELFVMDERFSPDWTVFLTRGVVNGLVVPPYDARWSDTSGTNEEIFNRRYVFVTRENLSEMTDRLVDPAYDDFW